MRRLPRLTVSIAVVAAVAIGLGALPPPRSEGAGSAGFVPVSTSGSAFGKRFRDWSAEWWQFALSLPVSQNPLVDAMGDKCAVGQHGEVWFLVGSFIGPVTRACSIPEGKALFFPAINLVDINLTTQTADELRAEIAPVPGGRTAKRGGRAAVLRTDVPQPGLYAAYAQVAEAVLDDVHRRPLHVLGHVNGRLARLLADELTGTEMALHEAGDGIPVPSCGIAVGI